MDIYRKHFGSRLKLALDGARRNQAWLAEKMNTSSATVSRWVNGHDFPNGREAEVARHLGMSVEELIGAPTRQRLAEAMAMQTLEDRVRLSQEETAAILPTILAKGPVERSIVLYLILGQDRFLKALPSEVRRTLGLLLESDPD